MPDLHALKCVCAVLASEKIDVGSVDLPGFFFQTEADEEDEPIAITITGAVALLLVDCDPIR